MKRKILFFSYFLLFVAGSWCIGFLMFVRTVFAFGENAAFKDMQKPFGIAVLTGGRGRIEKGIELLGTTGATSLLISGVTQGLELKDIAECDGFDVSDGMSVELGYEAVDTVGNAKEIKKWSEKHKLKSIIGVTSFYHIPRSRLEILHKVPDIRLEFVAVKSNYVKKDWWNSLESFKFLAEEYSKFLTVYLQYEIFRL